MNIGAMIRVILVAGLACTAHGQPANPPAPPLAGNPAATPPASGGGFSIEADIFAYKSLQSNSEAIACDIARYLSATGASAGLPRGPEHVFSPGVTVCTQADASMDKGVVVVSSTGSTIANFQVWRTAMLAMRQLLDQAATLGPPPSPAAAPPAPPDLAGSFSLAGQALTLVQGVLALFASSQSATGIAGTTPDQALMNDVSRQLRNLGVRVLTPDIYVSYSLGGIDPAASPFISSLFALMAQHSRLQEVMQRNLVIVNAAQKLQADLIAQAADNAKLPGAAAADRQAIQNDLASLNAEITQIQQQLRAVDVGFAQRTALKAQSLVSAIEWFLANLTGGNVAFAGQSPAAAATPAPSVLPGGSTPPMLAVLAADGLARAIGITPNSNLEPALTWRLLWLKTLESGGSLITESNILGSKVHFSGGAVATYDLFKLDGTLSCAGIAFAYGGYVRAKDFVAQFNRRNIDPRTQLVFVRGGCGPE